MKAILESTYQRSITIKVGGTEQCPHTTFKRHALVPSLVEVTHNGFEFSLPGDRARADEFIKAYMRCIEANVGSETAADVIEF